jgi:yjcQ protein
MEYIMAKDDYFVIVYYILSYLYNVLKKGAVADEDIILLRDYNELINDNYLLYIYDNLIGDGYIKGMDIRKCNVLGTNKKQISIYNTQNILITPKGIEYLQQNSIFNKIKENLKDVKNIMPFI